ncbi:endonuclease VII domain-containing protein [Streptomyces rochei]|uniref:endonuclease VII domain-containing protein n=2 Tax=Streptomyces rochei TaxID=1928 RepID=UPI0034205BCC
MTERTLAWKGLQARICGVDGCLENNRAKGLCKLHYQRHLLGIAMDAPRRVSRKGPCLVSGCERPRRSRGLCASHYERGRRRTKCPACGRGMASGSGTCDPCYRAAIAAQLPTEKTCRQCTRTLPVSAFNLRKSAEGTAKWRSRCRECEAIDSRMRAKSVQRDDRSKERLSLPYLSLRSFAKKLGIPWAEVVDRYPADNRCQICGRTQLEAAPTGRAVRLALDHCHETGRLRGFLCSLCNSGLGHLGDSPERLQAAIKYLRASAPRQPVSHALHPDQLTIPTQHEDGEA